MNSLADQSTEITYHIRRYDPEKGSKPYWKNYTIQVYSGMTVLDGLHLIKETIDPTLSWRYSCRMGVCGSCGMLIHGKPGLACNTQILDVTHKSLTVAPLPNFDIVKDLVPDLTPLFKKHGAVHPYIERNDLQETPKPKSEFLQTPHELETYLQFTYCIRCGLCMAACPTVASDEEFLGPMPLAQSFRYNTDTRDEGVLIRKSVVGSRPGAFRCHYSGECSNVCPKGVDPARAIQLLKRDLVFSYLKLIPQKTLAQIVTEPPKDAKRRPNIPDAPPYTVK